MHYRTLPCLNVRTSIAISNAFLSHFVRAFGVSILVISSMLPSFKVSLSVSGNKKNQLHKSANVNKIAISTSTKLYPQAQCLKTMNTRATEYVVPFGGRRVFLGLMLALRLFTQVTKDICKPKRERYCHVDSSIFL